MSESQSQKPAGKGFFRTAYQDLKSDITDTGLKDNFIREFRDVREFFIDEKQQEQLQQMGRFKRWLYTSAWLLKALFLKLTPNRRILFIISIVFIVTGRGNNNNIGGLDVVGLLILIFILMLELKDKLLARDELEAGRFVQHALMPERSPQIPGWTLWLFTRPTNEVGGDLLDYQQIDEQWYGVALGDVAGKGLGAALFMAKLQATLRAIVPDAKSLSKMGEKLNEIFRRDCLPQSFASLVYAMFRNDSGKVRILNAGHLPPLIVRESGIEEMPKGDPALGIQPAAKYQEQRIEINKGEIFLIYSDGVTEARNESGEFFGEKRLTNMLADIKKLSAKDFGEKIVGEVDKFVGNAKRADDLSIVVLKRM